ncbi:MAG: hypothetical protein K6E49_01090 [Lachnospiraceae bacterium]|nr:hypothetical protein [Lachnospiraceae bacterium]
MTHRNYRMEIVFFAVLASFTLFGCGSKAPEGYYTLSQVNEDGTKVKEDDLADYGLEDSYVVFDGDKGYLVVMNTPEDFTYDADKGVIATKFGDVKVKSAGSKITLSDSEFSMTFVKSDDDAPAKPEAVANAGGEGFDWLNFDYENYDWENDPDGVLAMMNSENGDSAGGEGTGSAADGEGAGGSGSSEDMKTFWNGDWYGWYDIESMVDKYKGFENMKISVLATTTQNDDGTGSIKIWENNDVFAEVTTSNNGSGLTNLGTMVSESGRCFERPINHAEWLIDPGLYEHKDYIQIDGRAYDNNDDLQFYYTVHLVKWGSLWDDFSAEELPDGYDWYKEQVAAGNPMPATLP